MRYLLVLCLAACSPVTLPAQPTIPEPDPLPVDARKEKIDGLPDEAPVWAIGVDKGEVVVDDGVLVSEALAARNAVVTLRYGELRVIAESDRKLFAVQGAAAHAQLAEAAKVINELQPTWLDRNKFYIGLGLGLFAGVATVVTIEAR